MNNKLNGGGNNANDDWFIAGFSKHWMKNEPFKFCELFKIIIAYYTKINVFSEFNLCTIGTFHASQRVFLFYAFSLYSHWFSTRKTILSLHYD